MLLLIKAALFYFGEAVKKRRKADGGEKSERDQIRVKGSSETRYV
jgi:hypothetical protein